MNLQGKMLENRYEVLEKIGIGGMATVYRAKCHVLNREVAVKVLKDEFTTDSEFIKRFNAEAQAAASLTHPNIVSVYDVGYSDGMYYIVMELIKGKTLKEIISESEMLPWKVAVKVGSQIAEALEIAHKNGIVHRDIKPHNIIITEDGVAKVTDFGIAKAVTNATITAFGSTIGSVHYFSPEHAKGTITDAKSDIYSLGIVMYEMVTGRVPFDADTPVSVALKQVQEKPIEPISINTEIPEGLNHIILRAMEKDKDLRYASARELLNDLEILEKNPDANFKFGIVDQMTRTIPTIKQRKMEENKKTTNIFKEKPWLKPALIALGAILVVIVTVFVATYVLKQDRKNEAFIPNFAGANEEQRKTKDEAIKELEELGFQYEIIEEFSDDVKEGEIIKQEPKFQPNFKIKTSTKIKIYVSKGVEKIEVPKDLDKKSVEDIKKTLDDAGIKFEIVEEHSETIEKDKLIKVEYEKDENNMMPKKDIIKVVVSKGSSKKDVVIPKVEDLTKDEANKKLKELGLVVEEVETYVEYKSNGHVTSIQPAPGQTVKEGTKVVIYVNKVPEIKKGKLTVNVKKLTENLNITEDSVFIQIVVDDKKVDEREVKLTTAEYSTNISSLGRSRVNIYVNESLKYDDYIDLNKKENWLVP